MEETQALGFNPAPICQVPKCPEKTSARLGEGGTRKDLCKKHALVTVRVYGPQVTILGTWNELKMEGNKMTEFIENEIDPDHPWAEASTVARPTPVPTQMKWEMVTMRDNDTGEEKPVCMLVIITPSGVQTYFLDPAFFNEFIRAGAVVLQEIGEHLARSEQGKIIIANKGMEQAVINEQKIHEGFRNGN